MSATQDQNDLEINTLNAFLRGELAATETYSQVINRLEDEHVLSDLQMIREDHAQAEQLLREKVQQLGGQPADRAEPWSPCAASMNNDSQTLSPATTLAALRQGEEHSINEFEDSLKQESINTECKNLIRSKLLPSSRKHVAELNRLMGGMN